MNRILILLLASVILMPSAMSTTVADEPFTAAEARTIAKEAFLYQQIYLLRPNGRFNFRF
jgi:hypothetical protein